MSRKTSPPTTKSTCTPSTGLRSEDSTRETFNGFTHDRALVNPNRKISRSFSNLPRFVGSGSHLGLTVIMNANTDDYHCSSTNSAGFKILLHSPIELPKIADYGISITPGYETRIVVTPNLYDTSDALRRVPRHVRQCVFEDEYELSYFRFASKSFLALYLLLHEKHSSSSERTLARTANKSASRSSF